MTDTTTTTTASKTARKTTTASKTATETTTASKTATETATARKTATETAKTTDLDTLLLTSDLAIDQGIVADNASAAAAATVADHIRDTAAIDLDLAADIAIAIWTRYRKRYVAFDVKSQRTKWAKAYGRWAQDLIRAMARDGRNLSLYLQPIRNAAGDEPVATLMSLADAKTAKDDAKAAEAAEAAEARQELAAEAQAAEISRLQALSIDQLVAELVTVVAASNHDLATVASRMVEAANAETATVANLK